MKGLEMARIDGADLPVKILGFRKPPSLVMRKRRGKSVGDLRRRDRARDRRGMAGEAFARVLRGGAPLFAVHGVRVELVAKNPMKAERLADDIRQKKRTRTNSRLPPRPWPDARKLALG